jgi:hypothetical protein
MPSVQFLCAFLLFQTFIDPNEYYINSITPQRGTKSGGTRVVLSGGGFNTNFYTGGNYVYIGRDDRMWQPCDVIEGACSVQCGGPNSLVCDTRGWTYNDPLSPSGWLDVKVVIEIVGDLGASETTEVVLSSAFYYYAISDYRSPMLVGVAPNAISSEDAVVLKGTNFGYWLQDYRTVYVGTGAPPQGGNVKTALSNVQKEATHAVCRPEEVVQ